MRSVLAKRPTALAKSRTCRGLTTTTGRRAWLKAATNGTSMPPVASITMTCGDSAYYRFNNLADIRLGINCGPSLIARSLSNVQLGLRYVNTNETHSHLPYALSKSRPCEMRALCPSQLFGLFRERCDDPRSRTGSKSQGENGLSHPWLSSLLIYPISIIQGILPLYHQIHTV